MPRPGPRRPNTAVRLDETTIEFLDRHAARRGVKRSDIIRAAIESWLAAEDWDWPGRSDPLPSWEPESEKISGEDPYGEYQQALDEHARDATPGRERTKRKLDRAWDAYQRHLAATSEQ